MAAKMSASKAAKAAGYKNLKELADIWELHPDTMQNTFKNAPRRFKLYLAGGIGEIESHRAAK